MSVLGRRRSHTGLTAHARGQPWRVSGSGRARATCTTPTRAEWPGPGFASMSGACRAGRLCPGATRSRVTTGRGLDAGCRRGPSLAPQALHPQRTTLPGLAGRCLPSCTPGATEAGPQPHARPCCWPRWGLPAPRAASSKRTQLLARPGLSLPSTKLVPGPRASSGRRPLTNPHVSLRGRPSRCRAQEPPVLAIGQQPPTRDPAETLQRHSVGGGRREGGGPRGRGDGRALPHVRSGPRPGAVAQGHPPLARG